MRTSWKKPPENGATRNKLLWSLAALGAAGALAGLGTFATFTDTSTEQASIDTGDVVLTTGLPAVLTVEDVVPGDTIQQRVNLTSSGDSLDTVTLLVTVDPDTAPAPHEDPSQIMLLTVDLCDDGAWGGSAPNFTCVNQTQVFADQPLLGAHDLPELSDLTGTAYLRFTLEFPDYAGNNYQDQQTTVSYTFLGVQRGEEQK